MKLWENHTLNKSTKKVEFNGSNNILKDQKLFDCMKAKFGFEFPGHQTKNKTQEPHPPALEHRFMCYYLQRGKNCFLSGKKSWFLIQKHNYT